MHHFDELVYKSTSFTLNALDELHSKVTVELQTSASTVSIKNLQMIQLQKAIIAIGMLSLFESILQTRLNCQNGFEETKKVLIQCKKDKLYKRFEEFILAINVLKHGKGRSYNALVAKSGTLPFKVKLPDENFFHEGDVSEVSTLIEVNDKFVLDCAEIIEQVSREIRELISR